MICRMFSYRMKMHILWLILCGLALGQSDDWSECDDKNWHSLENETTSRQECGVAFENRCLCSRICYDRRHQYVVNCTNAGFLDTKPLENLPTKTQVLIFTGNHLERLPWNIFGTLDRIPSLRVIDMSNNKIREIHGKTYHHVQNVQRLTLDFNELSLDSQSNHPRVFSNFVSLLELHLTDAFEDGTAQDLAETLHDIFVNSHLENLNKLHLEQNEITEFRDPNVFCNLPNLLDLHLGDNELTSLQFNLSCLHKLRFLDLQRNKFTRVQERDLRILDSFAKHNQSVTIDLSRNKFECGCKLNPFIKWMKKTKITVRNKNYYQCTTNEGENQSLQEAKNCISKVGSTAGARGTTVAIIILSMILLTLIFALVYIQRNELKNKLAPVIESVNKRVRYTSIATGETRENDV